MERELFLIGKMMIMLRVKIKADEDILKYIVNKGSVALDGTSLTVSNLYDDAFEVSLIPLTQKISLIGHKKVGKLVNIECDIIGKYTERLLGLSTESIKKKSQGKLNYDFLRENGYI
jgi:riboflavin synthase